MPSLVCRRFLVSLLLFHILPTAAPFAITTVTSLRSYAYHRSHYERTNDRNPFLRLQDTLASEQLRDNLKTQMELLRQQDSLAPKLETSELKIVYQDEHLIVVDKPSKVLSTSKEFPSLAQTVYEALQPTVISVDQMVVHRLGKETSGLMVLGLTMDGVRGLQTLFRTRHITRQYEALVCGHDLPQSEGLIRLPLMRDVDHPPFMRVSTDAQQQRLVDLDPNIVPHKLLEAPKAAMTHYVVQSKEYLDPESQKGPVTRLKLTSISGRTHQLNVHCAASGHPIVGDTVYGHGGMAAEYGGLDRSELPEGAASYSVQKEIQQLLSLAPQPKMCIHASFIQFRHPVNKEQVECTSPAPF